MKCRFSFSGITVIAMILFFPVPFVFGAETEAPAAPFSKPGPNLLAVNLPGSDPPAESDVDIEDIIPLDEGVGETFYDPLEPFNRAMFYLNDKLYFRVFKPVALGYRFLVPQPARSGVKHFFSNLAMPIRFVNSVLQFKFHDAGAELSRFIINATIGLGGVMDPARELWDLQEKDEDFGQTLGFYHIGAGFYIYLPFFGPSDLRDGIGSIMDTGMYPVSYVIPTSQLGPIGYGSITVYKKINDTSLEIGKYENIKEDALDPYVYIRDAYYQYRKDKIER